MRQTTRDVWLGVGALLAIVVVIGGFASLLFYSMFGTYEARAWAIYSQTSPSTIEVTYFGSSCDGDRRVNVDQHPDEIVVTVEVKRGASIPLVMGCTERGETFDITLDEPLEGRPVYDGACLSEGNSESECLAVRE